MGRNHVHRAHDEKFVSMWRRKRKQCPKSTTSIFSTPCSSTWAKTFTRLRPVLVAVFAKLSNWLKYFCLLLVFHLWPWSCSSRVTVMSFCFVCYGIPYVQKKNSMCIVLVFLFVVCVLCAKETTTWLLCVLRECVNIELTKIDNIEPENNVCMYML